ncbi:MAG TPA: hypothetical protein VGA85_02035 [Dehalococcoidales bacterium]
MSKQSEATPSIDLAFDWVKDVLDTQISLVDSLDNKAMTLFGVATAILGIGASLGQNILNPKAILPFACGAIAFIAYIFVIGFTISALAVRGFDTLKNPIIMREYYWDLSPVQFKIQLLAHLEDAYTSNKEKVDKKGLAVRNLVPAMAFEVVFLVLSLWLGFLA